MSVENTLVVVSCGEQKLSHKAMAKDMYTSTLFRYARKYAEQRGEWWRIVSAKYGFLHPNTWIEPYDETIIGASLERQSYFRNVVDSGVLDFLSLDRERFYTKPDRDAAPGDPKGFVKINPDFKVVALVGQAYKHCLWRFDGANPMTGQGGPRVEYPLDGLQIGQRLQWLKKECGGSNE